MPDVTGVPVPLRRFAYRTCMNVMVTVASVDTGEVLPPLGPFVSAREARVACVSLLGLSVPLAWRREEMDWVTEVSGVTYRVPVDEPSDAQTTPSTEGA